MCVGVLAICAGAVVSCGLSKLTPEEKAARRAAEEQTIREAVIHRHYRISVSSMTPLRAETFYISGPWITVDSTTVECSVPYLGRDDMPHFKTRGEMRMDSKLEFKAETEDYLVELNPEDQSILVSFKTSFRGSDYTFHITIDNISQARVRVIPSDRDEITYEGTVYASER